MDSSWYITGKCTSSEISSSECPLLRTEVQKLSHSSSDIVPLLSVSTDLKSSSVFNLAKLLFLKVKYSNTNIWLSLISQYSLIHPHRIWQITSRLSHAFMGITWVYFLNTSFPYVGPILFNINNEWSGFVCGWHIASQKSNRNSKSHLQWNSHGTNSQWLRLWICFNLRRRTSQQSQSNPCRQSDSHLSQHYGSQERFLVVFQKTQKSSHHAPDHRYSIKRAFERLCLRNSARGIHEKYVKVHAQGQSNWTWFSVLHILAGD